MGDAVFTDTPPAFVAKTYPELQRIAPHVTLQEPLSRRGRGPGLILVLDHYANAQRNETNLDPEPLRKWAEEGFVVLQLLVPGGVADGGEFPLERALEVLKGCESCEFEKGVGLISYLSRIPYYVEEAACQNPSIKALISYGGKRFTRLTASANTIPPQLIHTSGHDTPRRESVSLVPGSSADMASPAGIIKTYRYTDAKSDSAWILPSDENYHKRSASIAHTRSLTFLKPLLNGPYFDLEAIWEEHTLYEFSEKDVAKTLSTMVEQPYVNHIPTMTGGIGHARLTAFYTHHFIFSNPPDTSLTLVSRTLGIDRIVDEFVFSTTHSTAIPWLLPGIPPTGKPLAIPFTSVVGVRGDRLCHEHIAWDQASVLRQLGLLPEWVAFPGEIEGRAAPAGKRFEVCLPVVGVEGARKLVDEGCEESNALVGREWRVVDDV